MPLQVEPHFNEDFKEKYSKSPDCLDCFIDLVFHMIAWTISLAKYSPMTFTNVLESQIKLLICVNLKQAVGLHCAQQCRQVEGKMSNQIESKQPFLVYSVRQLTMELIFG